MAATLFLYIDILGFSDLIGDRHKVRFLFRAIDASAMHRDSNFATIVFSDTILAYNRHSNLSEEAKRVEVMYLIELTQEFALRLVGSGIAFRAVITEGEFTHRPMRNIQAYYGQALIDAYRAEKALVGTGLFLDRRLRRLNQIFRFKTFSPQFDFIYLTHISSGLLWWLPRNADAMPEFDDIEFPVPATLVNEEKELIYPELVHFAEVYRGATKHPDQRVRAKYLATWSMYEAGYPSLTRALRAGNFKPAAVAKTSWKKAQRLFEKERFEPSQTGHVGT